MRISDWSSDVCSSDLWRAETPDDFVFAIKGSRYITHLKRLREIETPLANFFASGLLLLGRKLGPILWQFPPNFRFDEAKMDAFFERLPHDTEAAARLAKRHDARVRDRRSEEHTSELQSLMRTSSAVFCLKKKTTTIHNHA